jgi:hypothetical protein
MDGMENSDSFSQFMQWKQKKKRASIHLKLKYWWINVNEHMQFSLSCYSSME